MHIAVVSDGEFIYTSRMPTNGDGSIYYIIGIRKDIRAKICKQPGDIIALTIRERG